MASIGKLFISILESGSISRVPLRVRLRTIQLLAVAALLVPTFCFLQIVLRSPTRTPLLILSSTYLPPWDINPRAKENADLFRLLDRHNLSVRQIEDPSDLVKGQWSELEDWVARLDRTSASDKPLLVYINLHGIVDANQSPFLLVRDSSPIDPRTWLSLETLLQRLTTSMEGHRSLVVFLEVGRCESILPQTKSKTTFAQAVKRLVDQRQVMPHQPSLSVLVSTSSNRRSVEPCDGGSDPFTRFLAEGLSGASDIRARGGNGNQRVELEELATFVQRETEQLTVRHRGLAQKISWFSNAARQPEIAWAARRTLPHSIVHANLSSQAVAEITLAWQEIAELQEEAPWMAYPCEWNQLVRSAVALETAAFSSPSAFLRQPEFSDRFWREAKELKRKIGAPAEDALVERVDCRLTRNAAALWQALLKNPSHREALQLVTNEAASRKGTDLPSLPWLIEATERTSLRIWANNQRLRNFVACQQSIESTRRLLEELTDFPFLKSKEHSIDVRRRWLEDKILCDDDETELDQRLERLTADVALWRQQVEKWSRNDRAQKRFLAEVPMLFRAIDSIESIIDHSSQPRISNHLESLVARVTDQYLAIRQSMHDPSIMPVDPKEIADDFLKLRNELAMRWKEVFESQRLGESYEDFAIDELLRSGFLPIEVGSVEKAIELRLSSRKKLLQSKKEDASPSQPESHEKNRYSNECENILVEFLAFMLAPESTETPKAFKMGSIESSIRDFLASTSRVVEGRSEIDSYRASQVARLMAGLGYDASLRQWIRSEHDLAGVRSQVDSANRVLDDFWGTPRVQGEPYFTMAAGAILKSVEQTAVGRFNLQSLLSDVHQRFDRVRRGSQRGVVLDSECIPAWEFDPNAFARCFVLNGDADCELPNGLAQLYIDDGLDKGSLRAGSATIELSSKMRSEAMLLGLPSERIVEGSKPWIATLYFRGNRFEAPFATKPYLGNRSTGIVAERGGASIVVQDGRQRRRARTLILDCSASMFESQPIEGSSTVPATKLDAARLAVLNILDRWRGSPDPIGCIFYGHRVAVGNASQGTLFQNRYFAKYPFQPGLRAFEDVETVLPPGRFGDQEFALMKDHLDLLLPWGQTPLYLAIQQAMANSSVIQGMEHDIIVISDGRNYQFNPTQEANVTLDQVVQQARQLGVHLHVIGFGVPRDEVQEATAQYRRLAEETGGTATLQIASAIQLIENLDTFAQPEVFVAQLPNGEEIVGRCGSPIILPAQLPENTPIRIHFRNQHRVIPVSAKSAIRMVSGADEILRTVEGEEPAPMRASIVTARQTETPFCLGLHRPIATGNGYEWNMALLRTDGDVAQRPRFLWMEIEPTAGKEASNDDTRERMYVVEDRVWAPNSSVPTLHFKTEGWPMGCRSAEVRFWCTDQPPAPRFEISLLGLNPSKGNDEGKYRSEKLPDWELQYEVRMEKDGFSVVLKHMAEQADVWDWMPQWPYPNPAFRVERRYSPSQKMSVHRFRWDAAEFSQEELRAFEGYSIRIYPANDFKRSSLRLMAPVRLSLEPEIAALPGTAAPQVQR